MPALICFELMLYVHGKQLRSCCYSQLLNHAVPGQASWRHFTSGHSFASNKNCQNGCHLAKYIVSNILMKAHGQKFDKE